jgi:predicted  nucleic acid-binding Zn-ribbon protein
MITAEEEVLVLRKTKEKLINQISNKDQVISALKVELAQMKSERDAAKADLKPVKDSLSKMTAERSKWVRKLRRAGIKE